jgi:hypothetical protein
MAAQLSVAVRNARLDAIETVIGVDAVLKLFAGAQPANCAAADAGAALAVLNLPTDYMLAAAAGSKAKDGTWQDLSADSAGTAGHFRLYATGGTVCGLQGSVTVSGGGGDLQLDNPVLAAGQTVTVTAFTWTDANA